MYNNALRKDVGEFTLIKPAELQNMEMDELVYVNRVFLNKKIVEFEIQCITSAEVAALRKTIRVIKEQDVMHKKIARRAAMRVADVMRLFPEYKSLPVNAFAVFRW